MVMENPAKQVTQHALMVVWGQFAQEIGLISGLEAVKLNRKTNEHSPQAKVLEFQVTILSGAKYFQEISLADPQAVPLRLSAPGGTGTFPYG
jgi:hypothetical protein